MSEITTHPPADAHSLRTTVVAAALVVAGILAAVAAASAPATAATVVVTVVAVLGGQRALSAWRASRRDAFEGQRGGPAPQRAEAAD
jgi:hypothetical protein